jgi:prepilin-type N-terminal cleavage/methylation domain-containing protein
MSARGFSFIELLVSIAIALVVIGAMFELIHAAQRVFDVDLERADMQQRARVSMDALFRDIVMAGAGVQTAPVAPFRRGSINPDAPGSAYDDRLSVAYVPADGVAADARTITYVHRIDAAGVPQLARYDGLSTELPLVDQIAGLRFEYFDASGTLMTLSTFTDGPWVPDSVAGDRFDADLLAIRGVRATLRVRPARVFVGLPMSDLEVVIDVSPRNVNLQ